MTTLLPSMNLAMVRAVARTAAVLLAAAQIDKFHPGRAISESEIADILQVDKRTVGKQLRSLSAAGLMLEQSDGRYVVTPNGRNTLFGWSEAQQFLQPTNLSIEETETYYCAQNVHAQNVLLKNLEEEEAFNARKDSTSSSEAQNVRAQNVLRPGNEVAFALENGLETVPTITGYVFEDGTPVYQIEGVDGSAVTAGEIVKAASMLQGFEDGIVCTGLPLDAIKPEYALGWISQAYDQRINLRNPAGLVYRRLRDIESPRPNLKYLRNPMKYLPADYLAALRLAAEPVQAVVDVVADPEPVEIEPTPRDEALMPLWSAVLAKMQADLPRVNFETWMRDTYPTAERDGVLIVAAQNPYCVDWLASRVAEDCARHAGRPVRFVVSVETEV